MTPSIATTFQYINSLLFIASPTETTLGTKKRQAITGVKTKSLHYPQLDHHDADGLAGHKTWRTTLTT
jgi:hypothetical protein